MANKQALQLYKALLRESQKFPSYNFRHYALRRIRGAFQANKALTNPEEIKEKMAEGFKSLEVIKRQAIIGNLYKTDRLVIENA